MGVGANYVGDIPAAIAPGPGKANTLYARESGYGTRRRTVLEFKDHLIAGADEGGVVGKFVQNIYTFPQGRILFEGASIDVHVERYGGDSSDLSDTFDGDFGLGTVVGAGATLATTEQNLIQTTPTTQAVDGATDIQVGSQAVSSNVGAPWLIDGVSAAAAVFFNLLVDDGDHDIGSSGVKVRVNGELVLNWTFVGQK